MSSADSDFDGSLEETRQEPPGRWLSEIPVRSLLASYEVSTQELGRGGFGTVVVGRKRHLPQAVAIKRIHADLKFSASDQRRFVREVQLLAPLQHPNIVRVEDWGRDDAGLYLVMELIDGPNLATLVNQCGGPLSLAQLLDFTAQICRALQWAHQHGIVHRDLKPANLLLDRFGVIKLGDFGLARVDPNVREGLTSSGAVQAFTYAYASPEQLRGDSVVDGRSDLFSLGATLFHLATGRADTSRTFDLDELPESLAPLQPLLSGLLRFSLAKRMPDVAAVLQVLDQVKRAASAPIVPAVAAPGASVDSGSDWSKILDVLQSRVTASHDTARRHLSSQRYAEAVSALEDIPQEQRHLLDTQLYEQCVSLRDQVRGLEQEIDSGVKSLRFEGLREKVRRLQKLQPWRTELAALLQRIPKPVVAAHVKVPASGKAAARASSGTHVLLSAPFSAAAARDAQAVTARRLNRAEEWANTLGMKFRLIPTGTFLMGSPDRQGSKDEHPQHKVTITKGFGLGVHTVTQWQWRRLMGNTPWKQRTYVKERSEIAATWVSWYDAVSFCRKLSDSEGVCYRLPTEAEWEWSCRAGTTTAYSFGDDAQQLGKYAWYDNNASDKGAEYAHVTGQKSANPFGLHDMHGNVWEWCQDWYAHGYGGKSAATDPAGPASSSSRVLRGGSWYSESALLRSAYRRSYAPDRRRFNIGFRVVCELE